MLQIFNNKIGKLQVFIFSLFLYSDIFAKIHITARHAGDSPSWILVLIGIGGIWLSTMFFENDEGGYFNSISKKDLSIGILFVSIGLWLIYMGMF